MRQELASPDQIAARIAARQHGVVSFEQLLGAGHNPSGIQRRVAAGQLHRIYRGVYAVGHTALSSEGRWLAAVLACGEGAVLSHRSAAELWTMLPASLGPIDITVPGAGGRAKRRGLRVHHSSSLPSAATSRRSGIAVTTPARTIADLRRMVPAEDLRRAIRRANFIGLDLGPEGALDGERSELERIFLRLCRRCRFPLPEVNVAIGPYTADFLWRERRLIVETDGWDAHRGRQAFEDDHARDANLRLRGFEVVRLTYRQVVRDPGTVAALLRPLVT